MNEQTTTQTPTSEPTSAEISDCKRYFSTVTPFSRLLAAIFFIALPFVGFGLGVEYGEEISTPTGGELSAMEIFNERERSSPTPEPSDGVDPWKPSEESLELVSECILEIVGNHAYGTFGSKDRPEVDSMVYTNPIYGFSFEIPGYWKVCDKKNYIVLYEPIEYARHIRSEVDVWVIEKEAGDTFDSVTRSFSGQSPVDVVVDGLPAKFFRTVDNPLGGGSVVIDHRDKIYLIGGALVTTDWLESVKFIDD